MMNEEFFVLSNKIVKYLNDATIVSRLSHWNVRGGNSYECHLMFGRIYDDLGDLMDPLVEQLRGCGFNAEFEQFRGPGIVMEHYDCQSLVELTLDYLMSLSGTIAMFYKFADENGHDPRLVAIGNQMQAMSSVVLNDQFLLQAYLGY
jgi:hypothetical protein